MFNKQEVMKKFNQPEEKLLVAKVLDRVDLSLKNHEKTFTDFLDPKSTGKIIESVSRIRNLNFEVFGGGDECERRVIGFSPDYMELVKNDFPIKVLKISRNIKYSENLSHRDYLGSILGLGIDRGKVGDIFLFDDYTLCYLESEIAEYVAINLTKVSRTKVKTSILDIKEIVVTDISTVEKNVTVSSLRLDAVIGAAFNFSRSKAQTLIGSEKVFVNWTTVSNSSASIKDGDMISVRGFGRTKIAGIKGKTRKDRIGIVLCIYI